jgi:hypothetical protein
MVLFSKALEGLIEANSNREWLAVTKYHSLVIAIAPRVRDRLIRRSLVEFSRDKFAGDRLVFRSWKKPQETEPVTLQ